LELNKLNHLGVAGVIYSVLVAFVGASQISGGERDVMQTHFAQDPPAPTTSERIAAEDVFANFKE
jgi:hypothetical protein